MTKKAEAKWYEVLQPSYINDRLYTVGETVQYDGEAGDNLKPISAKEANQHLKEEQEPDEVDLKALEQELNKREQEIIEREKAVTLKEKDLDEQKEKSDLRVSELDEREKAVTAKEAALVEKPVQPVFVDSQGKAKK